MLAVHILCSQTLLFMYTVLYIPAFTCLSLHIQWWEILCINVKIFQMLTKY